MAKNRYIGEYMYFDGTRINVFPQASHVSCIGGLGGLRFTLLMASTRKSILPSPIPSACKT